jgi:hypothetical protein
MGTVRGTSASRGSRTSAILCTHVQLLAAPKRRAPRAGRVRRARASAGKCCCQRPAATTRRTRALNAARASTSVCMQVRL